MLRPCVWQMVLAASFVKKLSYSVSQFPSRICHLALCCTLLSRESSAADQHAEAFAASAGLVLLLFYAKLLICNSGFHRAYKKIL